MASVEVSSMQSGEPDKADGDDESWLYGGESQQRNIDSVVVVISSFFLSQILCLGHTAAVIDAITIIGVNSLNEMTNDNHEQGIIVYD